MENLKITNLKKGLKYYSFIIQEDKYSIFISYVNKINNAMDFSLYLEKQNDINDFSIIQKEYLIKEFKEVLKK